MGKPNFDPLCNYVLHGTIDNKVHLNLNLNKRVQSIGCIGRINQILPQPSPPLIKSPPRANKQLARILCPFIYTVQPKFDPGSKIFCLGCIHHGLVN